MKLNVKFFYFAMLIKLNFFQEKFKLKCEFLYDKRSPFLTREDSIFFSY